MKLLIAPEGIEIGLNLQFGGRIIVLLIAPEGIEISDLQLFKFSRIKLLIAPEGIEITSTKKNMPCLHAFNRTRRN